MIPGSPSIGAEMTITELDRVNAELGQDPLALIAWALARGQRPVITSNFAPYSAVLLHLVSQQRPEIPVLWIDAGYATPATYRTAQEIIDRLRLNLVVYQPLRSRARREALEGPSPGLDEPERLAAFTREVKLEPFARAVGELKPDVWFTALRAESTTTRATMQPVSINPDGMIKLSPLLHWSSKQMYEYCQQHRLPNNFDYSDPTKLEGHRECGLHLAH